MSLEAETDFGLSLLRQQDLTGSVVFSPLSIAFALSLVHLGAKGKTQEQIGNAIAKGATSEKIQENYGAILKSLIAPNELASTQIANRMYINKNININQKFIDDSKKIFNADAVNVDFGAQKAAAEAINRFINETTKGKIPYLVSAESFSPDTMAFLTNAIYFNADWKDKFDVVEDDVPQEFFSEAKKSRKVNYLAEGDAFRNFFQCDTWQVLGLPFRDESFVLNILLPKERFGLQKAMNHLSAEHLQKMLSSASTHLLNIKLPKFRLESDLNLGEILKAIGIKEMFESSADLSGVAQGAYVSSVLHKAVFEINERGATAAAATGISVQTESGVIGIPIDFKADHPFLFILTKDYHPIFYGVHK